MKMGESAPIIGLAVLLVFGRMERLVKHAKLVTTTGEMPSLRP